MSHIANAAEGSDPIKAYQSGLDPVREQVISSHFMHALNRNKDLALYDDAEFQKRSLTLSSHVLDSVVLPWLLRSSEEFVIERVKTARTKAREHYSDYGLQAGADVSHEHMIAEVMFDKQFSLQSGRYCSRRAVSEQIAATIRGGDQIRMVIPALPFKFSSPLKTRGSQPDLGEINFLLCLFEIAATVDSLYRAANPGADGPLATFTVVSDGKRFSEIVNQSRDGIDCYEAQISSWIARLGIEGYVSAIDYALLMERFLPPDYSSVKMQQTIDARYEYEQVMWPIFDAKDMEATLGRATMVDPNPESENPAGRFVSLVKSLSYILDYPSLAPFRVHEPRLYSSLVQELTAAMFEPEHSGGGVTHNQSLGPLSTTSSNKTQLLHQMRRELWEAAIGYIAEIRGDRDLPSDPIMKCLPGCLRWTIHAKAGQFALRLPSTEGLNVQPWAGTGLIKVARGGRIKIATLPVLALEGRKASPVVLSAIATNEDEVKQPFFYVDESLSVKDEPTLLDIFGMSLLRSRTS